MISWLKRRDADIEIAAARDREKSSSQRRELGLNYSNSKWLVLRLLSME